MKTNKAFEEVAVAFVTPLNLGGEKVMYLTSTNYFLDCMEYGVLCTPAKNSAAPFLIPWAKVDHVDLAVIKKKAVVRSPVARRGKKK